VIEHIIIAAAPAAVSIDGGRILGTVGAGGIATALTVALVAGTRGGGAAPTAGGPPGGGGKKSRIKVRLTPHQAEVLGLATGTFYMAAGSFWAVGRQVSDAFVSMFTSGGFGPFGVGGVALLLGSLAYFREFSPGKSAVLGGLTAGVWAAAGGIWGLPQALILTGAHAIGLV
jgi:hypothetical protein